MKILQSTFVMFIFAFAAIVFAENSFEFDPQVHTATLQAEYIGFIDNSTNDKIGPELYANETESSFFAFVKNLIEKAVAENTTIKLFYKNKNSGNHGQYNQIIPDF